MSKTLWTRPLWAEAAKKPWILDAVCFRQRPEADTLGYIVGTDRGQMTLFPDRLEDWVGEDNPVRVVDLFVDEIDLAELGFGRTTAALTGRPGYHPSVLLKLFIYGLREAQIIIEGWKKHYNTKRPHSALGYRPPAPETIVPIDHRPVMH